jgi:epoxide hydrolase 4
MGLRPRFVIAAGGVAVLVALGWRSGTEAPVDTVAAVSTELGLELESSQVQAGAVRLHVVQAGPKDGAPVVLLHGFPEFWYGWRHQIAALARAGFRVIAPDQRGYNDSDKPSAVADYRLDLLAGDIAGLIRALGYEQAFVAGHDWGGAVAWRLALDHPERVRKLVIFNLPHPQAFADARRDGQLSMRAYWLFFQLPWLPEWATRLGHWRSVVGGLRDTARAGAFTDQDFVHYRAAWDHGGAMHTMLHWYRASMRTTPPDVKSPMVEPPVRLVVASNDAYVEASVVRRSVPYCKQVEVVELPDVGHWLLHEEPARTSAELVSAFGPPA